MINRDIQKTGINLHKNKKLIKNKYTQQYFIYNRKILLTFY